MTPMTPITRPKTPMTSAANCFVDAPEEFSPVSRRTWDGKFIPTGVYAKVNLTTQLHGAPFRFETVSPADVQKALDHVKRQIPDVIAAVGPAVWVTDHGCPAVGTVGSEVFIYLGDNLVALAPQWVLLERSMLQPHLVGQSGEDIQKVVEGIIPGRWNEVTR